VRRLPRRRGRAPERDHGFTVIELSVAGLLSALVLSAVVLVFNSVGQGATDASRRGDLQIKAREVVTDLAAELRSAAPPRQSTAAIESLSADTLAFYSDRYDSAGPERFLYERISCTGGYCQLRVRRYAAVATSGPNWTFQTTPFNDVILLDRIVAGGALFSGRDWTGSPPQKTTISSCGGATVCTFSMVAIDLQATPPKVSTIDGVFGVLMEVTLRNA